MKTTVLTAFIILGGLVFGACNSDLQQQQQAPLAGADANANANSELGDAMVDEYWAKDNLDLQRVGSLLERSDTPQDFERYLNEENGVNNLDLNGDGYVDYISVDEFEDRDENERGLSLYTRYGPDTVQELGTVVFYRDDLNAPGARILLAGDEHVYGDNYYYETNWLDRTLDIVRFLFSPRDTYYRSPYYYDNYPPDYVAYEVVETPLYVSRIERLYPEPVFVFTAAPTFLSYVEIKSPHKGKWMEKVFAKLAKPTREQAEFLKANPGRPRFRGIDGPGRSEDATSRTGVPPGRPDDPGRSESAPGRSDDGPGRSDDARGRGRDDQGAKPSGQGKSDSAKPNDQGKGQGQGQGQGQGKGKKP